MSDSNLPETIISWYTSVPYRFIQHAIRSHGTRSSCTGLREEIAGNGCATESCSFRLRAEKAVGYESDTNEAGHQRLSRSYFRLVWLRSQSNHPSYKCDWFEQGKGILSCDSLFKIQYHEKMFRKRRNWPPLIHPICGRNQQRRYLAETLTLESIPAKTVSARSA